MIACRYFDGTSSRAWAATIALDGDAVRLIGDGIDRRIARSALKFAPAGANAPARLLFIDGGLCEIDDSAAASALFHALGRRPGFVDRLLAHPGKIAAVVAAFIALMGALYLWGIPLAANLIVDRIPQSWDQRLGRQILATLDHRHAFEPSALPEGRGRKLFERFANLRYAHGMPVFSIEFRKMKVPNAFALPGGIIVMSDELVELSAGDDDALMTVFAHELGHETYRHALRSVARGTLMSALASWYLGDFSNVIAIVAGSIGNLHYSRAGEHEADLYALDMMRDNRISTHGMSVLFARMEAWRPPGEKKSGEVEKREGEDEQKRDPKRDPADEKRERFGVPSYLSTHPATADRMRLFDDAGEASREFR